MGAPLIGTIRLGLLYPLVVVPVGIIGATNGFNMLAGYNGLEAGMGVVILSTLGYLALRMEVIPATVIAFSFIGSLMAFLYYNKYPSRIFPGDTLTYPLGASIAIIAILANLERSAVILFLPYYAEFLLKVRGEFKMESIATVLEDGSLDVKDWYSIPHIIISLLQRITGKAYEYLVVLLILAFELMIAFVTLALFNPVA